MISQLHHIITTKQFAAAHWESTTSNHDDLTVLKQTYIVGLEKYNSNKWSLENFTA